MKTMDPSTWSPYSQQPFSHSSSGSPRSNLVQPATPSDESLASYGSTTMLLSPCSGLQSIPSRPSTAEPIAQQPPPLLNSHYDSTLLSPPISTSKETADFFGDNLYNGVCKENPPTIPDFIQTSSLPSRNEGCLSSESSNNGYHPEIPPVNFQPKDMDGPSPGPFGVLPHEAVMIRPKRCDRGRKKDNFIAPAAKPIFNNGPFPDPEGNGVCAPTLLSTNSLSNENTKSPIVNSVTSPTMSNFSSPSDYYSSPKNNIGAYNNVQSPVPQSPSVPPQHSFPPSPFTNIDPVTHIPTAPPRSPITSASYLSKLQERAVGPVPPRNGPKSRLSPVTNNVHNNNLCFNPPQSQGSFHHGHPPGIAKNSEYHNDYNVFPHHNHIPPASYPSVYPPIHPNPMSCDDPSITPRPHIPHPDIPPPPPPPPPPPMDNRLQYSHSNSMQTSNMGNSTYMQCKTTSAHDMMYGSCPSSLSTSQSMHHPRRYDDCTPVIDPLTNHHPMHHQQQQHHHQNHNSVMPPLMNNDTPYGFQQPDMNDDKNALAMFNTHIDSGVHNPDACQGSMSSFLESELPTLESNFLTGREMRISEPSQPNLPPPPPPLSAMNMDMNMGHDMMSHVPMGNYNNHNDMVMKNNNYNFNTNTDMCPMNNMSYPVPRGRGRRGRRRRADIHNRGSYCRYQKYKTERNTYYNNGFQVDKEKFPEFNNNTTCFTNNNNDFRNNDSFNQYQTSYKDRLDAYEFHAPCYTPSKYQSLRRKDTNRTPNCIDITQPKPKKFYSVEEELCFLGELQFPLMEVRGSAHTFMKTRNKDIEGFLQSYKNFLEIRKSMPDDDIQPPTPVNEHKHSKELQEEKEPKSKPKLIIKMGRCRGQKGWQLTSPIVPIEKIPDDSDSSESKGSANNISSHKISDDSDSLDCLPVEKSKHNSDFNSEKQSKRSAKRIFKCIGRNKSANHASHHDTNSETLPAGNSLNNVKPTPKKRGRKTKNSSAAHGQKKHSNTKAAVEDPLKNLPIAIKEEILSDEEIKITVPSRRSSLRFKREGIVIKEEPMPGPSIPIKMEPVELSSDSLDDSDSDPAWTPSCRAPKVNDFTKLHGPNPVVKKRRRSGKRNNSHAANKRIKKEVDRDVMIVEKPRKTPGRKPRGYVDPDIKIKLEKKPDLFVVSKSDLEKEKPPIWRVDNETRMIQRFDAHEEQGLDVYRNTYAYAAWNDVTRGQYVQAKVKVLTLSRVLYAVQYLGLEETSNQIPDPSELSAPHPLRESFEIFLQTLISQAVDEHFLSAIINENDEYFLANINKIEKVSQEKKNHLLLKRNWAKELKECAELYPCVNILSCDTAEARMCQICCTAKVEKLVQFYGPPYDNTTLGSTESPTTTKPQFNMCSICATTISLYSRLHHQKYNFFVECRGKVLQFQRHKQGDKVAAFHDILDHCLHDSKWISMLFHKMEEAWNECDKVS